MKKKYEAPLKDDSSDQWRTNTGPTAKLSQYSSMLSIQYFPWICELRSAVLLYAF